MEDAADRQRLWKMMKADAGAPQKALLSLLLLMMLGMVLRALHILTKCSVLSSTHTLSRGPLKEDWSIIHYHKDAGRRHNIYEAEKPTR